MTLTLPFEAWLPRAHFPGTHGGTPESPPRTPRNAHTHTTKASRAGPYRQQYSIRQDSTTQTPLGPSAPTATVARSRHTPYSSAIIVIDVTEKHALHTWPLPRHPLSALRCSGPRPVWVWGLGLALQAAARRSQSASALERECLEVPVCLVVCLVCLLDISGSWIAVFSSFRPLVVVCFCSLFSVSVSGQSVTPSWWLLLRC